MCVRLTLQHIANHIGNASRSGFTGYRLADAAYRKESVRRRVPAIGHANCIPQYISAIAHGQPASAGRTAQEEEKKTSGSGASTPGSADGGANVCHFSFMPPFAPGPLLISHDGDDGSGVKAHSPHTQKCVLLLVRVLVRSFAVEHEL